LAAGTQRLGRLRSQTHRILVEHDLMAAKNDPLAQFLPHPGDRLAAFSEWLERTAKHELLDDEWWGRFLQRAYESGLAAGNELVGSPASSSHVPVPAVFRELAKREFAGIVGAILQQASRQVANAALTGLKPAPMYRSMLTSIRTVGWSRMKTAVNSITVQLHNAGRLEQFKAAGISHVGIDAERLEIARGRAPKMGRVSKHDHLVHDLSAAEIARRAEELRKKQVAAREAAALQSALELERAREALAELIETLTSGEVLEQTEALARAEAAAARAEARAEVAAARAATAAQEAEAAAQWEQVKAARAAERRALYPGVRPEEGPPRKVPEWKPPPGFQRVAQETFGIPSIPERLLSIGAEFVNVLTAGDEKVCQECQDLAAEGPYSLFEAWGMLPAHPNCRCAFVPFTESTEELGEEAQERIE
jgi:hypothetical protein